MQDKTDYIQMFDLKPEEWLLKILICAAVEATDQLPKAEFVDPTLLPTLPYSDQIFNLALCPNVLFSDKNPHTEAFHVATLLELARVGSEVRIFPLVDKAGAPAKYLGSVIKALQEKGLGVELRQVDASPKTEHPNAMLRLWNPACVVKTIT